MSIKIIQLPICVNYNEIYRPKSNLENADQSTVPSIAPPPKVPTSLFQDVTASRFNPFDQEISGTSLMSQG